LFEGETGEQAPWFLRPSITFPLAFAVMGAAFWVTFASGGINEKGAQKRDELDEIIISSAFTSGTSATSSGTSTFMAMGMMETSRDNLL
jgi:hypothetical protein